MKEVTVYSVAQDVQIVPDMSCRIERFDYHREDAYIAEGGLFNLNEKAVSKRFIPIRQINRHTALYQRGSLSDRDYVTETRYIAIDPELEEVINLPVKEELREVQYQLNQKESMLNSLEICINEWKDYPWYKRVWLALKKEI